MTKKDLIETLQMWIDHTEDVIEDIRNKFNERMLSELTYWEGKQNSYKSVLHIAELLEEKENGTDK